MGVYLTISVGPRPQQARPVLASDDNAVVGAAMRALLHELEAEAEQFHAPMAPALLKVRWGLNEIITTLMMNYVALNVTSWLVKGPVKDPAVVPPQTVLIPREWRLPAIPESVDPRFFALLFVFIFGMALTMIILGVFYLAQGADFLGVIQIFVYTGAVMMLFLFVVMLVGVDSSDSVVETLKGQRAATVVLSLGLGALLVGALGRVSVVTDAAGDDWMVYHGRAIAGGARTLRIDPLVWNTTYLPARVSVRGPTTTPQQMPRFCPGVANARSTFGSYRQSSFPVRASTAKTMLQLVMP